MDLYARAERGESFSWDDVYQTLALLGGLAVIVLVCVWVGCAIQRRYLPPK